MTHDDDTKKDTVADLELPTDSSRSRLTRPQKLEASEDVATAGERIALFWEKYPEGSILTEIEAQTARTEDDKPFTVYTARAFIRRDADAESPSATAHATRSETDPDPVTAAFAQETAETSAVSRALKNVGILPVARKPAEPDAAPPTLAPKPRAERSSEVADARRAAGLTQLDLAKAMRAAGISWTQAVVSKVERGNRAVTAEEGAQLAKLIGYSPDDR